MFIDGNLNAAGYREILNEHVVQEDRAVGANFMLVDDNATPHRHNLITQYLTREGITRMNWPSKSPDLNPIEHVWAFMKYRLARRLTPQHTLADLRRMVQEEWDNVTIEFVNRLIRSMNTRARQIVRYGGGHIDY